jgi:acylphosphatase
VQGVFYRQSAKEKAIELSLTGFAQNRSDGSVYIEAEGDAAQLNKLVMWCHQGPNRAVVEGVSIDKKQAFGYTAFEIK